MLIEPQELLKNSPLAMLITDQSERIVWCNSLFLEQTSLPENAVVGQLYVALPLEAIDKNAQTVQLFTNDNIGETRFQYWQVDYNPIENGKVHYFVKENASSNVNTNLANKLHNISLPKRSSWLEFLDYEVSRSRRYDNPLSILKLHLLVHENPKNIESEIIQKTIKDTLMDELRWADMIGHTDQGSYLIVLPETPLDSISALQEKINKSLNKQLDKLDCGLEYQLIFADACWRKHDDSMRLLERARTNLVSQLEKLLSNSA